MAEPTLDKATIEKLNEVGLSDIVSLVLGTGKHLRCQARRCVNHGGKGLCSLPASEVFVDRNWECGRYQRKA